MKSLYEIKRAVVALQKEVEELKAKIRRDDATTGAFGAYALGHSYLNDEKTIKKDKPNGEKRAYRKRNLSPD